MDMTPDEFEEYVADILEYTENIKTAVTQSSRDGGVDIVAEYESKYFGEAVVQVKKHSEENKVGSPVVQKIIGAKESKDVDRAWVVTSGYFSNPALEEAEGNDVVTVNCDELVSMAKDYHETVPGQSTTSYSEREVVRRLGEEGINASPEAVAKIVASNNPESALRKTIEIAEGPVATSEDVRKATSKL
jgi:restriction endonuclease Mrr